MGETAWRCDVYEFVRIYQDGRCSSNLVVIVLKEVI
jgi:hypothetical protein